MFCSGETGASPLEDRLHAYVDDRVEQLRVELLAVFEAQSKVASSANDVEVEVESECSARSVPINADHLDQHDMHKLGKSVWDCAMLIGLDCIGLGESVAVVVLLLLNFVVQVYFCIIVYNGPMLENPLKNEVLDELLHFRTSVAHKVEHADLASGRSLLSQLCNKEERLHVSGTQRSMYEDLEDFHFQNTGLLLVLLALLCWSASMLSELNSTTRYGLAILQKKGKSTLVTVHDGGFRLESLCPADVLKVFLLCIVPRVIIACLLYIVGALYLARTTRLEDLLLNAMALAFIMDVDELFFAAFVPHRVKSLIWGIQPLLLTPLASIRRSRFRRINGVFGGSLDALLRVLLLLSCLVIIYFGELRPFHGRLKQAMDILCSGDTDFVYSLNPASGMTISARSANEVGAWAAGECVALQLARPALREEFGWNPPGAQCNESYLLRPYDVQDSLEQWKEVGFSKSDFQYVSSLAKADIEQATVNARCVDVDSDKYLSALKVAVAGLVVAADGQRLRCEDVQGICHLQNMTKVRALCPRTCECDLWGFTAAGFFKTPNYGCPDQCIVEAAAAEERWRVNGTYPIECIDFTRTRYFFRPNYVPTVQEQWSAMDSDEDGNVTSAEMSLAYMRYLVDERFWSVVFPFDLNGDGIWDESEQSSFDRAHNYVLSYDINNDSSLSPSEIQSMADPLAFASTYNDVDGDGLLTATEMAGHQPGEGLVAPPLPRRITPNVEERALNFLLGLKEYILARPNFQENLATPVEILGSYLNLTREQKRQVFDHIASGAFVENWYNGIWELGPGILHPRGFVWCEFITSWEINLLLGLSVCRHEIYASVRGICPESCSCQAQTTDCPSSCPSVYKLGTVGTP